MQIRLKMELKCEEFTEFPFICSLFSFNSTLFELKFIYRNITLLFTVIVFITEALW